ncbi:HAMP domain-containing sensor histidine kinase [Paucibacter sp. APW11]|uniref:histidine kinase n=1 Tax=Roseateles aquae TaxID=3077235 RepID=A0ABU3P8P6_9BURK|nr:HAMP domain-containing sensor histidine kinase [Paucibacter sp. APW11]MDT8998937.1 HAMP domain-containing sensor histidine kinase [Paucibacter sp. APW11]
MPRGVADELVRLNRLSPSPEQSLELEALALLFRPQDAGYSAQSALAQVTLLLGRCQTAQAALAEAAAWRALQWHQMQLKLFKPALHSAAMAAALYDREGEAELSIAMRAGRCKVLYMAEMYPELRQTAAELLSESATIGPKTLHLVLNSAATAAYYLAIEIDAERLYSDEPERAAALNAQATALWDECLRHHRAALQLADTHGLVPQNYFSHVNLAVVCATLGLPDECRLHMAALGEADVDENHVPGWWQWREHCEVLLLCHSAGPAEAMAALLAAEQRLAAAPNRITGVMEATLQAIERFGQRWGFYDEALRASMAHLQSQRQLTRDLGKALDDTAVAVMEQPRLLHENAELARQGSALESSLLQRNAELSNTLGRLQAEASIRHAAEAALQAAHDELEQQVAARTAELEQAMLTLMQQEKQLALSRMVAGMAHEMNTPLDNARMATSAIQERSRELKAMLAQGGLRRVQLQQLLQALEQGGDLMGRALARVSHLLQRFRSLAQHQGREQSAEFDLVELLLATAQSWQNLLHQQAVRLQLELPDDAPLRGYPDAIRQVLQQLLENSLQHGLRERSDGLITLRLQPCPDQLELAWADNGCGISAEHLPHVFEPFFTTQLGRSGTGLGLASVHSLVVDLMGGQLCLDSEPGQGTCITITLPRACPAELDEHAISATKRTDNKVDSPTHAQADCLGAQR